MIDSYENFKQIDDIIDARKKLGQYNVCRHQNPINYRYAYSSAAAADKFIRFDDAATLINEGDYLNAADMKRTDSEITVVRVRCDRSFKKGPSKWDMHDIAVPGDGTHLGDSPSLVNLATLVQQNDEYLVPLSSWDPCDRKQEAALKDEDSQSSQMSSETTPSVESKASTASRRSGIAGKITKFLRRHCKRQKSLGQDLQRPNNST